MSPEQAARRARDLYPRSAGFRRAYLAGYSSGRAGSPAAVCPYRRRGWPWRRAWLLGHAAGTR